MFRKASRDTAQVVAAMFAIFARAAYARIIQYTPSGVIASSRVPVMLFRAAAPGCLIHSQYLEKSCFQD